MNKTKSILLLLSLSLIGQAQSAPVTVTPSSTVLMKRITPAQLSGGSSGITSYSDQCSGRTATWTAGGTCSSPTTALSNGASQTVSSTNGNTGSATFVCDGSGNRLVLQPGSTCSNAVAGANDPCSSQTVTWGSCSATAAGRNHNQTVTVTDSTSPGTGTATFTCNDTSYVFSSGSCSEPSTTCTSRTLNWTASGNNCASVSGVTNDGANKTLANTLANGNTGSATFSCSAATDNYTVVGTPTCASSAPTACTSQTLNWSASGNSCSALSGATNDGASKTLSSTASNGNTGTGRFTCNASTDSYDFIASGSSCSSTSPPPSPFQFKSVSTGGYFSCGVLYTTGLKCWGGYLGIGDGSQQDKNTPADVSGLSSGVSAVSSGGSHACALLDTGAVKCWGFNSSGQLGDGTTTNSLTPTDVSGLASGVTSIAAGGKSTCALLGTGGVKCWGENSKSQLGDGTINDRYSPVDVAGLQSNVTAITLGDDHGCALLNTGGVKCWGSNSKGKLGDGTTTNRSTPVDVTGLSTGVVSIVASGKKIIYGTFTQPDQHTCALLSNGGVKCWGENKQGQLGDGTALDRSTPVDVMTLSSGVTSIQVGDTHSCAQTQAGDVKCWGNNSNGRVGDGSNTSRSTPVNVVGLGPGVLSVSPGGVHTCAVLDTGAVKCWGLNVDGQLGNGTNTTSSVPVDVVRQ